MTALSVSGQLGKQDCTKYNESGCTCVCMFVLYCWKIIEISPGVLAGTYLS